MKKKESKSCPSTIKKERKPKKNMLKCSAQNDKSKHLCCYCY